MDFVSTTYTPVMAIVEASRSLMNHQSMLNTEILGPMLKIHARKTTKNGEHCKTHDILIDYDMGDYGWRLRVHIVRTTRWGRYRCTSFTIPSNLLARFEDGGKWEEVHRPFLCAVVQRLNARVPMGCFDTDARVVVSTRISDKPPMRIATAQ